MSWLNSTSATCKASTITKIEQNNTNIQEKLAQTTNILTLRN